ncbi:MAG: PaaI family thioesterase [Proteobacteria bacterium]|nr:PaaI family thioesterase [Pseudomonadota bacterium]
MLEYVDTMDRQPGFREHLGILVREVTTEQVTGELVVGPEHLNAVGRVHGGVVMAFADELGARGTVANLPPGCQTATIESKTNFFRGIGPGMIRGESVPLHRGRNTMVWQTTVFDTAGKRAAVVTQTQMVLRPEPAAAPKPE